MRFNLAISTAIATAALLLTLATQRAHAQSDGGSGTPPVPYTCDAPCGGDSTVWPWSYPRVPIQAQIPSGCWVTAWYRWRTVCKAQGFDGFQQVEITSFSWNDPSCINTGFDPVAMIRAITYKLLRDNPMGFKPRIGFPADPQCVSNTTVQAATCWINQGKAATNCGVDSAGYACCKGAYQICKVIDPNTGITYRDVHWIGQQTQWNNCVAPCIPSCGAFDDDSIYTRKKDDPPTPSMSAVPTPSLDDTTPITASTPPAMIEPKVILVPQRR
jgi:hypothetical protein